MDANTIAYLITNVGFAIVVSLCCMYYIREQNKDARAERKELLEEAREERKELLNNVSGKIDSLSNLICALNVDSQNVKKINREIDEYGD